MAKKSLGQHWLNDEASLNAMVAAAGVKSGDKVLEIGPGHGSLTKKLLESGARVTAVEIDEELASELQDKFGSSKNFRIINDDFTFFNLSSTGGKYKVAANIPYFLTGKILRKFIEIDVQPDRMALLVQKEVAENIAGEKSQGSVQSVLLKHSYDVELGKVVDREKFSPPPKIDSRIIVFFKKKRVKDVDFRQFARIVKIGFSSKRKKLSNNLIAGLQLSKADAKKFVTKIGHKETVRAQELSLDDWYKLLKEIESQYE